MVKFWDSSISEWDGQLTLSKGGGTRSFMTVTIWWPRSGERIYHIVDVGVPSTRLVPNWSSGTMWDALKHKFWGFYNIFCIPTNPIWILQIQIFVLMWTLLRVIMVRIWTCGLLSSLNIPDLKCLISIICVVQIWFLWPYSQWLRKHGGSGSNESKCQQNFNQSNSLRPSDAYMRW